MCINYNEDYGYANERLSGSFVKLDNSPVLIEGVGRGGITTYRRSYEGNEQTAQLKEFDLTPFKLGYMNSEISSFYLVRNPARVYKQGLREGVLNRRRMNFFSSNFVNCVQNVYPNIERCFDLLINGEVTSIAFSRRFSLNSAQRNKFALIYKDKYVGFIDKGNKEVNFSDEYTFLKETFERSAS